MKHPTDDEWMRLIDGEVAPNRARPMLGHADRCGECRSELARVSTLVEELKRPLHPPRVRAAGRVMDAIVRGDEILAPPASRRRGAMWLGGLAAAAAAAAVALLVVLPGRDDPGVFRARGTERSASDLDRLVGVHVRVADQGLGDGDRVTAATMYTIAYRNRLAAETVHALIFAVDAASEVHWLYPAFVDPSADPAAVPLPPADRDHLLPEAVVFDDPAPGPMHIVSVIGREPMWVSGVESLSPVERTVDGIRNRFPKASVNAITVDLIEGGR